MRRVLSIAVVLLALAAIGSGYVRREHKRLYINAVAICYSCIGLE
ncbi:MAG: hypothetical protein Q7U71_10965 [bacterium]|nr:hypothetical protein [bacterium]